MTDTTVTNEPIETTKFKKVDRRKKEYLASIENENKMLKNELEMVKEQINGMQKMIGELISATKIKESDLSSTPTTVIPTVYAIDQVKLRQDRQNQNQKWKKEKEIRTSWVEIKGQKKVQVTQISYQHEFENCGCGNSPCKGELEKGNRGQLYLGKAKPNEQQHKLGSLNAA